MAELGEGASRAEPAAPAKRGAKEAPPVKRGLELVAMRGRDVIGVRHLLDGGSAWIGNVGDALARIPMNEFGGQPFLVGQVSSGEFALHVPPRARARMHGVDGLGRLWVGPHKISLREGDRAVVVLGGVQIRAQVVPIETLPRGLRLPAGAARWIAFIGAVYVAALALCAALSPQHRAEPGPPLRGTNAVFPKAP